MERIGLFGGTFNPIHRGHLWAAEVVQRKFGLNRIIFIPSAVPPHKAPESIAPAMDRLEMIYLATAQSTYSVSDVELNRKGPSYTIDTVHYFQSTGTDDTVFFLIVGLDAFLEMNTWESYRALFSSIPMLVLPRPVTSMGAAAKMRLLVDDFLKTTISDDYGFSEKEAAFFHSSMPSIYLCCQKMLDISATDIRARVARGKAIDAFVPAPVRDFIAKKGLYR